MKQTVLGDIITFKNGKKRPKESGSFPVYGGNGILGLADSFNYENCIIIGRVGAYCGSVFRESGKCWISDNAIAAIPKETTYISYSYYLLKSKRLNNRHIGTGQPLLTQEILNHIECYIPDYKEQVRIADILSVLDDKIENNKKINRHLEALAQAVFKSWFVDFDPFGGKMPEDWREAELDDVTTLSAGGDKPTICSPILTKECAVPIFSNGIDNFGLYGYTDRPKVTDESVTVSARGTVGYVCLRQEPFVPIVRLVTAIPKSSIITAKYLYLYLRSIRIAGVGTTQQQLTVPDFKKYRILVPNLKVIENFTKTVVPMFDTIRHKRAENTRLAALRDTLLPRLLSGELEVIKDEIGEKSND